MKSKYGVVRGNLFLEYAAGNLVRKVAVIGRAKVERLDNPVC